MNLTQLRSFHAVASAGGFVAGASAPQRQPADADGADQGAGDGVRRRVVLPAQPAQRTDAIRPRPARHHAATVRRGAGSARVPLRREGAAHRASADRRGRALSRHRDARRFQPASSRHHAQHVDRQLLGRAARPARLQIGRRRARAYRSRRTPDRHTVPTPSGAGVHVVGSSAGATTQRADGGARRRAIRRARARLDDATRVRGRGRMPRASPCARSSKSAAAKRSAKP